MTVLYKQGDLTEVPLRSQWITNTLTGLGFTSEMPLQYLHYVNGANRKV